MSYDHRHWLIERFEEGKRKNPRWSLRRFAAQLGVAPSALSEILSGKRPLSAKMSERLGKKLGLSEAETKLMVRHALLSKVETQLPDDGVINALREDLHQKVDQETFAAISEWYYFAILSLSEVKGSRFDASWISRRLGISRDEAAVAMRRLVRLGLVETLKGGKYRQSTKALSIETKGYEPAIRQFLHQAMAKAGTALDQVPAELREVCSVTMAIDPKNLDKARRAVKRFRQELTDILQRGSKERVYTFNVQLVPLDQLPT